MKKSLLSIIIILLSLSASADDCGFVFYSQEEVDDFSKMYVARKCDRITYLAIYGSNNPEGIRNLDALSGISTVYGTVYLNLGGVTSLSGLDRLTTVEGDFGISGMDEKTSLQVGDFPGLISVKGHFTIMNNPGLGIIFSFFNLQSAGIVTITQNDRLGDVRGFSDFYTTSGFYVYDNELLSALSGFDNLVTVKPEDNLGVFTISDNPSLLTITGFQSLQSVNQLDIRNNNALTDISSFNSLRHFDQIQIHNNASLSTISGFNSNFSKGGTVNIAGHSRLTAITGFNGLKTTVLSLSNNAGLIEITGFDNVEADEIQLIYNDNLKQVSGFANIKRAETLSLWNNSNLETISGFTRLETLKFINISNNGTIATLAGTFPSLNHASLESLSIYNNPNLSYCSTSWVCAYIVDQATRRTSLNDNAPGCQQPSEVLAACSVLSVGRDKEAALLLFPNPVSDYLQFGKQITFTLFDGLGKPVLSGEGKGVLIETLPPGIYILKTGNNFKKAYKIVKN